MKSNKKIHFIFKLWLFLYKLENTIWERYSHAFMKLNGGKEFHEYYQEQPDRDEIPF